MTYAWISFVAAIADQTPGGMYTLAVVLLLIALIIGLLLQSMTWYQSFLKAPWKRKKKPRATPTVIPSPAVDLHDDTLDDTPVDEMTQRALAFMSQGDYRRAIREWLRVQVRELVDRGIVLNRPGMTVTELARDGSAAVPALAQPLDESARLFSDVWYGGYEATPVNAARMRELTDAVRHSLPQTPGPILITVEAL